MGGGRGEAGVGGRNRRSVAGDGRGGDRGAQLELGHGRRKRKEERERVTAPEGDK